MKKAKRILALVLAVVMVLGLVPVQGREVKAAPADGYESAAVTNGGENYVIVYKYTSSGFRPTTTYYALQYANGFKSIPGSVNNGVFTPDDSNVDESTFLWNYNNGFTLASNPNVKVAANRKGTGGILGGYTYDIDANGSTNLTVNGGNQLRCSFGNTTVYLSGNNGSWSVSTSTNANFSFYQKPAVTKNLTLNWFVDDVKVSESTTSVAAERYVSITKPNEVQGKVFVEASRNGNVVFTEMTDIKINEDTTVNFYYETEKSTDKDFPEYPHPGSVKQTKTAEAALGTFEDNGVAKVELGVTGLPMQKPVEVVLVFDTSASMDSPDPERLANAKQAANAFLDVMFADNADGTASINKVGLVTFNSNATKEFDLVSVSSKQQMQNRINGLTTAIYTNYDAAFTTANSILASGTADAQKYIVFMTDGGPTTYNGYSIGNNTNKNSYVIRNGNVTPHANSNASKTAGYTVYSIGFMTSLGSDNGANFSGAECDAVLRSMSSGAGYYYSVDNPSALADVFKTIATSIRKAGTDASVADTIGSAYTLQMTPFTVVEQDENENNVVTQTMSPKIEVRSYQLDENHNRIGEGIVKEVITFKEDGTPVSDIEGELSKDANGGFEAATVKYIVNGAVEKFEWTIGDITQEEITLSYYVYLKGSMEGNRNFGVYPTNERATLSYSNYLDHPVSKDFPVPTMPWGGALVHYQFYLVNDQGQPVNSLGQVVDFQYRVEVTQPKEKKFPWNGATAVEAGVVAKPEVPEGYTLHIDDAAYEVHSVSSSAASGTYEILGTVPAGSVESTIVYQADKQCVNTYVAFGVLNRTTLIPDAVVLDYGKPVSIDVMANDRVQNAVLDSVASLENRPAAPEGEKEFNYEKHNTPSLAKGFGASVKLINGTANINKDKEITYTLEKYMDSIDKFLYSAKVTTKDESGQSVEFYKYQEVKVIPATTVYYEDNFGNTEDDDPTNGIVYSGSWDTEYEGNTGSEYQDAGNKDGADETYGYDSGYADNEKFSAGQAHIVSASDNTGTTASFKFKGTGFDIISRTDNDTAVIKFTIKDEAGKTVKSSMLNTFYQDGVIYQIPIVQYHTLDYGTYTVEINVKTGTNGHATNFYLDAIRIYNPLGFDSDDAKEAGKYYNDDNEADATVTELRDTLIDADTFEMEVAEGTAVKGSVYVDSVEEDLGYGDTENVTKISTYAEIGPNNEVYLKRGQSVAFELNTTAYPESVQIGAKAPSGNAVVSVSSKEDITKVVPLNTATDMYYDITGVIDFKGSDNNAQKGIVVITNTGAEDSIVSLTNIKVTYDKPQTEATELTVDQNVAEQAIAVTMARMKADVEIVEPEQPDVEVPEIPEAEKPENSGSKKPQEIIKEIVDTVKNVVDEIRDIFGHWFK